MRSLLLRGFLCLALVLSLAGCRLRVLHLRILDFDSAGVEGLEVWRIDEATGRPTAAGRIRFLGVTRQPDGAETLEYQVLGPRGEQWGPLVAFLLRDPADPAAAEMTLFFHGAIPAGWFRVSTYNVYGSSTLSAARTYLL